MIYIKGIQKTSLVDYPPNIVSTIFLGYCNFRCPYCHNPDLVLKADETQNIMEGDILKFLEGKKIWLDGVCISGGEPTMHKDLPGFLAKIKELGLKVKIDTNGSYPEVLKELIDKKLVDYVAMDIKAPLDKYEKVAKINVDVENIKKSADMVRNSGIDYEFRVTVLKELLEKDDLIKIGEWLKGSKKMFLQQLKHNVALIDKDLEGKESSSMDELHEFKRLLEPYFEKVDVRSI